MNNIALKHICILILSVITSWFHPAAAQNDSFWLWPIKGKEAGKDVICSPQMYIGDEFNSSNLMIAAPEGTEVLCPADGTISNFGTGYHMSLLEAVSFHTESDNYSSMLDELEKDGNLNRIPVPVRYVSGYITILTDEGRMIHIFGLAGSIPMKTGMRVSEGTPLGKVAYAYHRIGKAHIILSVSGRTGKPDDPMTPFGIKTTFLEPEDVEIPGFLTEEQASEDISVLMDSYMELFPSMHETVTYEQFNEFRADALNAIKGGIEYPDFYDIVRRSTTSELMHDSHIRMQTPNPRVDVAARTYVPNIIHGILKDTVFVRQASEMYREHAGKRIVSIDGIPSAEICQRSKEMVTGYDGNNRSVVERLLLIRFWYLYGRMDIPRTVEIILEDGTVIEDEWIMQENSDAYYPRMTQNTAHYRRMAAMAAGKYGFEKINDTTVLFRLSSFDLTDTDLENIADTINDHQQVPNMIIDVRYNAGGEDTAVRKLASYFLNRPSVNTGSCRMVNDTTFESLKYSVNYPDATVFHGYVQKEGRTGFYSEDMCGTIIPDPHVNYKGKLYILTDETSNSAATLFPSILSRNQRAVIVGRETGSGYHYMTAYDYARIMLPNSRITVQIPIVKYILDDTVTERYPAGRGLLPDYEVPLTYEEIYTSENDPVLDKALSIIDNQVK